MSATMPAPRSEDTPGLAKGNGAASDDLVARLAVRYRDADALALLRAMIGREFPGRIALVSSFGAESAALLDLVARVDRSLPVLFLNTGKLFAETLPYRDQLVKRLGLSDVREIEPDGSRLGELDAGGDLWSRDPDLCCHLRKVEPLRRALEGFSAWITGRKRYHGGPRRVLQRIEAMDRRIKINLLADWSVEDVAAYLKARGLPPHPLVDEGFLSVGCVPCTDRVDPGEGRRAGRWRGSEKTECGIHLELG